MVRFKFNETTTAPVSIYTHPDLSETDTGVYRAINAIVDSQGNLFVATHWGQPDRLYLIRSFDGGSTWVGPYEISSGNGPWYYPHLEVTSDDLLVCTYDNFGQPTHQVWFAKSTDQGETWQRVLISNEITYNPSLLTIDGNRFFVFGQSGESAHRGLDYNHSPDQGATWSGWTLIDST